MNFSIEEKKANANLKTSLSLGAPLKDPPDLLADLSLELRTPLNAILGFASLLQDPFVGETDRKHFLQRIISNGDHLLQVLDDALNFSKIQKGGEPIETTELSWVEMVSDLAQSFKSTAQRKGIDLVIHFKTSVPQIISSDPLKVRQILSSLLGQAIRYAGGEGFLLMSFSWRKLHANGGEVMLEIDDSSLESLSTDEAGARPGFALSQEFAKLLGGRVTVGRSPLGEGRVYQMILPTPISKDSLFIQRLPRRPLVDLWKGPLKSQRLQGLRILLAEDSEDNEAVMKLYLQSEGARLASAHNGLEAIDAVAKHEFDLILMDLQMPLLDGLEATREIRQLGFRRPIIALTAQALRDDAAKSLQAGCDAHLAKPIRKEALVAEIQRRTFLPS